MNTRTKTIRLALSLLALSAFSLLLQQSLAAQQAAQRFVGTITAINGTSLSVKTDAGDTRQFDVPDGAILKRVEPGQKDLSSAAAMQLSDLAIGDRVLVRLDPNAAATSPQAAQIVAIKQADVLQKQQGEREDWQRNGVGGLVKSVDPAAGTIVVSSGAAQTLKIITIHVAPTTALKRYAAGSVRFDQAQTAPISAIQAGDQLRARGTKNADGSELQATEVVSGSFRNISGTIASLDAGGTSFTVKDLITKKQVTVHITPDAQMRALPDTMARMIAARLKGASSGPGANGNAANPPSQGTPGGSTGGNGQFRGQGRGQGGGDMQQALNRAPAIQFSDLKKGDAVMLVATAGSSEVTAITLLTGVEPLLEAPQASNLLSNWSMGSGGAGEGEAQ
jgi:hypothetical protein